MIVEIIAIVIGILLIGAGIYYYSKEKDDAESRKIYSIVIVIGVIITAATLLKIFVLG